MSDKEALKIFSRQPVSQDMVNFLVATTNSIIQVKPLKRNQHHRKLSSTSSTIISPYSHSISLTNFIKNVINYSNVQTPTLMATIVYLNKLRNLLPANAIGMETTRHRIFLSALIVAAKSLNDSSPLNKHWTKYTDGLLTLEEVNLAERELLNILNWKTNITKEELIISLYPFLQPIIRQHEEYIQHQQYKIRMMQKSKAVGSSNSIESKLSLHSSSSSESLYSDNLSESSYNSIPIKKKRSMISIVDSTILYKN